MFSFAINKNEIIMTEFETVTSGSVNVYECNFNFSEDWEGLAKTVTFRAGYTKISVLLDNTNKCSIPWEVLAKDAVQLYCGVRGTITPSDEEEEAIIPTMYCLLGTIRKGTELGDNAAPPEPSVVDQLISRIETLDADKQDKLHGMVGQVVGFDADGNAVAQDNKSPEYKAGENISITGDTISAKNSTYSIKKIDTTEPGIAASYNLINTDEEGAPVGDAIKIPEGYDDTGIRATLEIVSEKVDSNTDAIASNTSLISANAAEISNVAASVSDLSTTVSSIGTNVSRNTDNISALSTTVAAAGNAIKKNTEDISSVSGNVSALSDSVAAAGNAIKKNTEDIANVSGKVDAVETNVSNLSNSKQNKITGKEGQIVGFNANGEPVAQDGGGSGEPGKDGVTFVPMVSESGIISWTNDGGRENPEAVNIMGPKGEAAGFGTVTATVSNNTGTPSVTVETSGDNTAKNFNFEFNNLKGEPGTAGAAAGFGNVTATVNNNTGTPSVTVETSGDNTAKNFNFEFNNLKGEPGTAGAAAGFGNVTATVTNTTGTPSVTVTTSGSNTAKNFDFTFSGLKGESADPASIPAYSVTSTAGSTSAGIVDTTYRLTKDGVVTGASIITKKSGVHLFDGQGYIKNKLSLGTAVTVSSDASVTASLRTAMLFEEYYAETDFISSNGYFVTDFKVFSASIDSGLTIYMKSSSTVTANISYIDIPLSTTLKTNSQASVRKMFKLVAPANYFTVYIGSTTSYSTMKDVYFDGFIVSDSSSNQSLRLMPFLPYGGSVKVSLSTSNKGFTLIPIS